MNDLDLKEQRLRRTLKAVAERVPVPPGDEMLWTRTPAPGPHGTRRLLVGVVAGVLIIAAVVVAVTYGPRSSPEPGAGALGSEASTSVVGSYAMTYLEPRTSRDAGGGSIKHYFVNFDTGPIRLTMEANGTFIVPGYVLVGTRNNGTWKQSKGTVTLTFAFPPGGSHVSLVQTIRQLGANLGSRSKPGVVLSNGKQIEKWYAVRNVGRSHYEAAKAQWMGDALVSATGSQGAQLQLAVTDLKTGEVSDSGNTSGYGKGIAAIKTFESMPITDVTPVIDAQENAQIATINRFFGLPPSPWPGECDSSGPGKRAATAEWEKEPIQSLAGVAVGPLKKAVTDLRRGRTKDRGDTSCYPAAIVDLQSLESATRAEMTKNIPFGYQIGYLNLFFQARQYVLGGPDNVLVG